MENVKRNFSRAMGKEEFAKATFEDLINVLTEKN